MTLKNILIISGIILSIVFALAYISATHMLWSVFGFLTIVSLFVLIYFHGDLSEAKIALFGASASFKKKAQQNHSSEDFESKEALNHSKSKMNLKLDFPELGNVQPSQIICNNNLRYHDYLNLTEKFPSSIDTLYREAAKLLCETNVEDSFDAFTYELGTAISNWVAHGLSEFSNSYPGMTIGQKKAETTNLLFRAAIEHLSSGKVIRTEKDNDLKVMLQKTSTAIVSWVQREYLEQDVEQNSQADNGDIG